MIWQDSLTLLHHLCDLKSMENAHSRLTKHGRWQTFCRFESAILVLIFLLDNLRSANIEKGGSSNE